VTGARYLLDTNVCIHLRQGRSERLADRFRRMERGEGAISVITFGELAFGAENSAKREPALAQLVELTQFLPVLPLREDAGLAYGAVRAALTRKGSIIGPNELWIAAHALAASLILVTGNEREFRRVAGLSVENWL